jgi:FkbM family methyltransferase
MHLAPRASAAAPLHEARTFLSDSEALSALLAKLDELKVEMTRITSSLRSLKTIRQRVTDIEQIVTGPRAVPVGDGLILAKLKFDDILMVIEERDRLLGPRLIMNGIYEKGLTAYFRSIAGEIETFVDVGANIGYYTVLLGKHLRRRGRLFAFEPDRANFALLQRNAQINWIDKPNIVLECLAVSETSGTATIHRNSEKPANTSLLAPTDHESALNAFETYEVPTISLDEYFRESEMRIDLMKIDVEGHELATLRGARDTLAANPDIRLVFEWDPARWERCDVVPDDVLGFLDEIGFTAAMVSSRGAIELISHAELANLNYGNLLCTRQSAGPAA